MKRMKKLMSLFCTVLLLASLSTAAFAVKTPDQAEIPAVSVSMDATSFSGSYDGCWWNIEDMIYVFLPETWEEQELTEEDRELGYIASFEEPDSVRSVMFNVTELEGLCEDAVEYAADIVIENGYDGYENTVNGYPAVIYFDEFNYVNVVMGSTAAFTASFYPADDSDFTEVMTDIIRTITPAAMVDAEDITDIVLGQVILNGTCEIPVTVTNASADSDITGFFACPTGVTEWENALPEDTVIGPGESLSGFNLTVGPEFLIADIGVRYGDGATQEYLMQELYALWDAPLEIICEHAGDSTSISLSQTVS